VGPGSRLVCRIANDTQHRQPFGRITHRPSDGRAPDHYPVLSGTTTCCRPTQNGRRGCSTRREPRRGLLNIYNLGYLRPEHNFYNAIPRDVIANFDEQLRDLLLYHGDNPVEHRWYAGPVYLGITWTSIDAAERGHFDLLKSARELGYTWNEPTCAFAAKQENTDVLGMNNEHICGGHWDMLRWAREHGCSCPTTCALVAQNGHLNALVWRENAVVCSELRLVAMMSWNGSVSKHVDLVRPTNRIKFSNAFILMMPHV
jgi:hypothetical protein